MTNYTEDEEKLIVSLYKNGVSLRGIGKKVNTSHHTVKNFLNSNGIDTSIRNKSYSSRQVLTNQQILEMSELYNSGSSYRSIGSKFGIDHNTAKKYILLAGVESRDPVMLDERKIIDSYLSTGSLEKAGKSVGASAWAAKRILDKNGIEIAERKPSLIWKEDKDGYIIRYNPESEHANSTGIEREHRTVMGEFLGRRLDSHETVHHINGIRSDNRIENLQLRRGNHGKGAIYECRNCGSNDIINKEL